MTTGSVARRYAKALYELGDKQGNLLGLIRNVQSLAEVWSGSEELREVMTNPLVKLQTRRKILKEVLSKLAALEVARHFAYLLFDKSRLEELPDIGRELGRLADEKQNRLRAEVIAATPVSDVVVTKLKYVLERLTGKVVILTTREDPGLIGGMVTRVGDLMYDGSIKGRLKSVKEKMLGHA
jgi:F-type H+-transporting ATPase subunit delta